MTRQERILQAAQDKEHIIWDWNGTLLDDVDFCVATVNRMLADHELPAVTVDSYRQVFEFPVRSYYLKLGFDFEKESFESMSERFNSRFMEGVPSLKVSDQTKPVLQQLHQLKKTQSILSAAEHNTLQQMVDFYQLTSYFTHVFGVQDKLAASKIERGQELIRQSGIAASKTVIIGDTLHDLEVAKALGADAILLGYGHQCATRLRPHHDLVID